MNVNFVPLVSCIPFVQNRIVNRGKISVLPKSSGIKVVYCDEQQRTLPKLNLFNASDNANKFDASMVQSTVCQIHLPLRDKSKSLFSEPVPTGIKYLGSGFVYQGQYVVTAAHLFEETEKLARRELQLHFVLASGERCLMRGKLVAISHHADVALIYVKNFGTSFKAELSEESPRMGEEVWCVGTPNYSQEPIVTKGLGNQPRQRVPPELMMVGESASSSSIIGFHNNTTSSSCDPSSVSSASCCPRFLQLSISTLKGMSGSPIFDRYGHVCGILTKKFLEFGLGIPIEILIPVTEGLIASFEKLEEDSGNKNYLSSWAPPSLGLTSEECVISTNISKSEQEQQLKNLDSTVKKESHCRLRVVHVFPATPADRADLRPGDVIQKINGHPAVSLQQLAEAAWLLSKRGIELEISRDGSCMRSLSIAKIPPSVTTEASSKT